jgi:DNA mismatch repair ATPase MutS
MVCNDITTDVDACSRDWVFSEFVDGIMRSELETRLLHLNPTELLLQKNLSSQTESIVKHLSGMSSTSSSCRIERIKKQLSNEAALSYVTGFLSEEDNIDHEAMDYEDGDKPPNHSK